MVVINANKQKVDLSELYGSASEESEGEEGEETKEPEVPEESPEPEPPKISEEDMAKMESLRRKIEAYKQLLPHLLKSVKFPKDMSDIDEWDLVKLTDFHKKCHRACRNISVQGVLLMFNQAMSFIEGMGCSAGAYVNGYSDIMKLDTGVMTMQSRLKDNVIQAAIENELWLENETMEVLLTCAAQFIMLHQTQKNSAESLFNRKQQQAPVDQETVDKYSLF